MSVFGRRWRLGGKMCNLAGFEKYLRVKGLVAGSRVSLYVRKILRNLRQMEDWKEVRDCEGVYRAPMN
jgi:hypothetical protein